MSDGPTLADCAAKFGQTEPFRQQPFAQKAIVVRSTNEARRLAEQMGLNRATLSSREWVIVPMGNENAVRGRRFDLVLLTDDARRSVNPDALHDYLSRFETRLTREGKIVFL